MRRVSLVILSVLAITSTVFMGAAQAAPAAPAAPQKAAACSPGGPYHEGDKAVWHNCDGSIDRIKVRQYFPKSNYEVCVAPYSSHHNSWFWTIDMYLIHDGRC